MPVSVQSIWQRLALMSAQGQRYFNQSLLPWLKRVVLELARWLQRAQAQAQPMFKRLQLVWRLGVRILVDPEFAHRVSGLLGQGPRTSIGPQPDQSPRMVGAPLQETPPDSALVLLGLLQKEGRFVDFIQEDIRLYSDEEVGRGARVVHQGCRRVIAEYLTLVPVCDEPEGSRITLEPGFDASAIRPTGHLVGDPPFIGTLAHRGWRVIETRLPQIASGHDPHIIAAAEVEL